MGLQQSLPSTLIMLKRNVFVLYIAFKSSSSFSKMLDGFPLSVHCRCNFNYRPFLLSVCIYHPLPSVIISYNQLYLQISKSELTLHTLDNPSGLIFLFFLRAGNGAGQAGKRDAFVRAEKEWARVYY